MVFPTEMDKDLQVVLRIFVNYADWSVKVPVGVSNKETVLVCTVPKYC